MPCKANNTCSGLPGAAPPWGVLTYTERMGVPTRALLTPGAATTGVAAVHTSVDTITMASQKRPSVRGIERFRVYAVLSRIQGFHVESWLRSRTPAGKEKTGYVLSAAP